MKKTIILGLSILTMLTLSGCDMFKKKENKEENKKEPEKVETDKTTAGEDGVRSIETKLNNKTENFKIKYEVSNADEGEYKVSILSNDTVLAQLNMYDEVKENVNGAKTSIFKGKDGKEYLLVIIEGGSIPREEMYILSSSKLLAHLTSEENLGAKLTGNGNEKYVGDEYNVVTKFYSISNNRIDYLKPVNGTYSDDDEEINLEEYVLTINNDEVKNEKTNNKYVAKELEGGTSSFVTVEIK